MLRRKVRALTCYNNEIAGRSVGRFDGNSVLMIPLIAATSCGHPTDTSDASKPSAPSRRRHGTIETAPRSQSLNVPRTLSRQRRSAKPRYLLSQIEPTDVTDPDLTEYIDYMRASATSASKSVSLATRIQALRIC